MKQERRSMPAGRRALAGDPGSPAALVAPAWEAVKALLEDKRNRIRSEITAYPRPIAGCDVQFNGLLEEHTKISRELDRLSDLRSGSAGDRRNLVSIREFIASSDNITENEKQHVEAAVLATAARKVT